MVHVVGDVLVDEARREARQRLGALPDGHLDLGVPGPGADQVDRVLGQLEAGRGRRLDRHRRYPLTPTRIPRNRAGTAGCPVWPICWGWPLPQFGVPQNVHSSRLPSMSIEPQKRGLIAV